MFKTKLNGTLVSNPIGYEDLVLEKERSDIYKGFIKGSYGYINADGGLRFLDEGSRRIIDAERHRINGRVEVEILFCNELFFKGILDFASLKIEDCAYEVQLVRDSIDNKFTSRHEIEYALKPTRRIIIPTKKYFEGGEYIVDTRAVYSMTDNTGVKFQSCFPLSVVVDKTETVSTVPYTPIDGMQNSTPIWTEVDIPDIIVPLPDDCLDNIFRENIEVSGVGDEAIIGHHLNTDKIEVRFFDEDGRDAIGLDWQPVGVDSVKIYLPYGMDSFTGDVYIRKRFTGTCCEDCLEIEEP